jgi:hypothetical protein
MRHELSSMKKSHVPIWTGIEEMAFCQPLSAKFF